MGIGTLFAATGDTFTLGDGVNNPVTFEFELNGVGADPANRAIAFDGTENEAALAVLITDAINQAKRATVLAIAASTPSDTNGAGGAGGQSGDAGATRAEDNWGRRCARRQRRGRDARE